MKIRYEDLGKVNQPYFEEIASFTEKFLSKGWYILGEQVASFEGSFASYLGAKYCVGVGNGLDAITLSLSALDLAPGSEVLVSSNAYIASILGIIKAGYKPVLVEPELNSYNLDPEEMRKKISDKTAAVLVVHLYGRLSQMDAICKIAEENNLHVVEDCAQMHGARQGEKFAGTFGKAAAFSFYPTKNLGALGDGGAIVTDDPVVYEKCRALRNYGSEKKYFNKYLGVNSRLDEFQAGVLNIKLPHLDKAIGHKISLARVYNEMLCSDITKPLFADDFSNVFHIYPILSDRRDELKQYLLDSGVQTEIHYPLPPHKQEGYKGMFNEDYPISELIHERVLSLPISTIHSKSDVEFVAEMVNSFYGNN